MIRKIFAPIRGDGKGENVLRHAAAVARRFGSHIEATHCRPRPEDLMPYGVPVPGFLRDQVLQQARDVADAEEKKLLGEFEAIVQGLGLPATAAATPGTASIRWIEEEGRQVEVIKRRGRICDLLVVAKPDRDRNLGANTLKAALFHVGRPVLMAPPTDTPPELLGERLAVAWNGSLEAVRATAMARPLIEKAASVTVLAVDETRSHAADAQCFVEYLDLHGVAASIRRSRSEGGVGRTLLAEAADCGADLLLMGAYGDSHERETIFGGNTQTVVDMATMPVVFVH